MKNLPKIFIVEDDAFYGNILKNEILKNRLGEVEYFSTGEAFMDNLFKIPDIVLLDHNLGSMQGVDILKKIKSINPNIQVIILSAQEKLRVAITSLKYGAYDYVEKNDFALNRIVGLIKRISKINQIVEDQKQFKFAKIFFSALVALIVLVATLAYTLYGGLRVSIFTDTIQMIVILILFLISVIYLTSFTGDQFSFSFIKEKNPHLLSGNYIPNYTAGLTFFIAVAATNLFHQGNWQRVYAAKNNDTLKKSLIFAFILIIPIVLFMGFSGLVAVSVDSNVRPDLGFFSLLLRGQTEFLSIIIVILGLSLTISTVDTLVNAISSLIVVDGRATFNFNNKADYLKISKYFIIGLSIIAFIIASKGFSILYLFLLADLFCCAFVMTVFYSFYNKKMNEKTAYISIIVGLIGGFLLFPAPDFSKSLLVGIILPIELFPAFVSQSLLFLSFMIATFIPVAIWKLR